MTDHELKRQLQEKLKFHELDLPANDWNAFEKRLPVAPRRIAVRWSWSVAVGVAAVALVAILLYQQPSSSLPTSPAFTKSEQATTENTNGEPVKNINTSTNLLSQVGKTEESAKDNKKVDTKKEQKKADKHTKSKRKTTDEDDNANDTKDTESIETAPKEEENQKPSLHEQEDDGAEYIVQLNNKSKENQSLAQTNSDNKPSLSIQEAEVLMKEQDKQQMAALEEKGQKSSNQSGTENWNVGLLASITPEILTMSDVAPTVLMDNSFSYRSMNRVNAKHDLPIMVGASVGIPIAKGFSVHTGINYAYIHSIITKENALTGDYAIDNQKLHYLGIPVLLSYKVFDYNIVQCYVSGGGMAEKGLVQDVHTNTFDQTDNLLNSDSQQTAIKGLQFSLIANVGLGVQLYKGLNLFFEPGFTWYIANNSSPQPENIRTEHPYNLSLTAGLRYNLNK
ncbi:MAG: outer membrane beta-barrel protein [Paludibacteraceae bacterium]|nr:outer membrane beta-barrel protein [Paludibacteraceae bacterium]